MNVTIDEVKYIAKLSKLRFTDEEAAKFASEFEGILENFKYLNATVYLEMLKKNKIRTSKYQRLLNRW